MLYLWLVVVTGVRRRELCGLQIGDVDLDRGLVHVAFKYVVRGGQRVREDTKTHQDRWLAIDPDTGALIAAYLDETGAALAAVGAGPSGVWNVTYASGCRPRIAIRCHER